MLLERGLQICTRAVKLLRSAAELHRELPLHALLTQATPLPNPLTFKLKLQ